MKRVILVIVAVAVFSSAAPASAGPIVVDAGWYGFCFEGSPGDPAYAGCQNDGIGTEGNTFTFDAATSVLFKITDAFLFGDVFSVVIDGNPAVLTSLPGAGGITTSNPDLAFANPDYSKLSVMLAAGSHSIDVFFSSGQRGGAYLEVETDRSTRAVPDAGSAAALLGLGMIGLSTLRRKLTK